MQLLRMLVKNVSVGDSIHGAPGQMWLYKYAERCCERHQIQGVEGT